MVILKIKRGLEKTHSLFKSYQFDKKPIIEYINLTNASKFSVEEDTLHNYFVVLAVYGKHKEIICQCYTESEALRVIKEISILATPLKLGQRIEITLEELEANIGILFVKHILGSGSEERTVFTR